MSGSSNISTDILLQLYQCNSGELIWEIYQCDGNKQCYGGSDEVNCKYLA